MIRITDEVAPAGLRSLRGIGTDVGEAGALGPSAATVQPAPSSGLPATVPAPQLVMDPHSSDGFLAEVLFVVGLALLVGYLMRNKEETQP